jgi:putative sigma-54 modulation protein
MNLTVTGQNFDITDAIKKNLNKRLAKTGDRLFDNANIHFSLYVDKNRHMAEATVKQKGLTTRAKDETMYLYLTVDNVLGKVEKQLDKHKSRTKNLLTKKT